MPLFVSSMQRVGSYKVAIFGGYFLVFSGLLFASITLVNSEYPGGAISREEHTHAEVYKDIEHIEGVPQREETPVSPIVSIPIVVPEEVPLLPSAPTPLSLVDLPENKLLDRVQIIGAGSEILSFARTFGNILSSSIFRDFVPHLRAEITNARSEPRGRMTEGLISIISPLPESESVKVFTHEFGHAVDLEYLLP